MVQRSSAYYRLTRSAGLAFFLLVLSCRPDSFREPPPPCSDAPCQFNKAIEEARRALDNFSPVQAEDNFRRALTIATENPSLGSGALCTAQYGLLLSYTQLLFLHLNSFLGGIVDLLSSGDLGSLVPQQSSFRADLLDYLENFYLGNFSRALEGIARVGGEVLKLSECEYTWEPGIPFRLLTNDPFSRIQNDPKAFGIELRVGKRWDGVEARLLVAFSEFLQGIFGYLLAHSFDFDRNQWTQIPILGQDLKFIAECFLGSSTFMNQNIEPTLELLAGSPSRNQNRIVDTVNECIIKQLGPYLFPIYFFRRLGFIVGDNPQTLARHPRRWGGFMPQVDNHFAQAFSALTDLFPALSTRSLRYASSPVRSDILREFALVFEDRTPLGGTGNPDDPDGVVNRGDSFSLGIVDILVKVTPVYNPDYSTLAKTLLTSFSLPIQDELSVTTVKTILETLRDQFYAVDDPGVATTLLRVVDFTPILHTLQVFFPSGSSITPPNALAFNFTRFFTDPVPLRELTPYWEAITSLSQLDHEVNEFIIEAEFYPTVPSEVASALGGTTVPVYNLFISPLYEFPFTYYAFPQDRSHFRTQYEYLDLSQGVQTPLPRISFTPTPPTPVTHDCYAPRATEIISTITRLSQAMSSPNPNLGLILAYLIFSWAFDFYHYYFLFQDPSFHGLLWVNTSQLPVPACNPAQETTDFQPANLYTLHRTMIGYYHWFRPVVDNIFSLIAQLSGP